jgi:hypothetical protein
MGPHPGDVVLHQRQQDVDRPTRYITRQRHYTGVNGIVTHAGDRPPTPVLATLAGNACHNGDMRLFPDSDDSHSGTWRPSAHAPVLPARPERG